MSSQILNPIRQLAFGIANAGGGGCAQKFLLSARRPPAPYQTPDRTHLSRKVPYI